MDSSPASSTAEATHDVMEDAKPTDPSGPTPTLSKSAQKKLLKAQKREGYKLERRAKEKAAKAAKKAAKREQAAKAASMKDEVPTEGDDGEPTAKKRKLADGAPLPVHSEGSDKAAAKQQHKEPFGAKVVVDLGFDDKMTEGVGPSSELNFV